MKGLLWLWCTRSNPNKLFTYCHISSSTLSPKVKIPHHNVKDLPMVFEELVSLLSGRIMLRSLCHIKHHIILAVLWHCVGLLQRVNRGSQSCDPLWRTDEKSVWADEETDVALLFSTQFAWGRRKSVMTFLSAALSAFVSSQAKAAE